jgi:hypothetical protein
VVGAVLSASARLAAVASLLAGCASAPAPPPAATDAPRAGWWRPPKGVSWQWQLEGRLDLRVPAGVFDVDGFDTPAAQVSALHARGRHVICYISVGAYEDWRPDSARFPSPVIGGPNGWPGERWVDIRRWDELEPILAGRLDMCRSKGFDAVEPDNVDGYANRTGFPLTADDQIRFNRRVADLAHERGLAVGLKNDLDQVGVLEPFFDFAVNEECFRFGECERLEPFLRAGKAVFHVEYHLSMGEFCPRARAMGLSSLGKTEALDASWDPC